jgi:TolB-like protein
MKRKRVKGLDYLLLFVFAVMFSFSSLWASTGYETEIDNISKTMADKIADSGKKKVAVVDFTDLQGNVTELGRFIAEEFSTSLLIARKGFTVIDRTHLKTLLKEHKLSAKGLIDPATAKKLGKIAGVEALITGTLTPLGESVKITVKLLDTETAALIDANRGNIPMTGAIKKLMETGVGSSTGPKTPSYKPKTIKSKQSKVVEDFTFDLLSCKISDRTVTITLMITNNADDRKLSIVSDTRLYDDLGNEYQAGDVKIANTKASLWSVGSSRGYLHYVGKELISGVPTKTIFPFQKVNSKATLATSFKIYCREGRKRFSVNFRNIPLTK